MDNFEILEEKEMKIKRRRLTSTALILSLVLSLFVPAMAMASEDTLKPLPKVGDVISGFKATALDHIDMIDSDTVTFEHEKTGAQLLYIQNNDINRSFEITFKTPAFDDTGVNHVLEHASVSGSERYPFKNLLFTILNQTYCSFVNAFTAINLTSYPVSSMSEAQLLKLSEVYLDCVFNPYIYQDENIFKREAWRYELESEEAPLTITGTVFSEMKGSLSSIETASYYNVMDTLFPDSVISKNSGGDPDFIPELTYEHVLDTHDAYYHPSNCLIVLYGDLDYENFLEMIDSEFLSKYDFKDIEIPDGKVEPFAEKKQANFVFPTSADSATENSSRIEYVYALNDISERQLIAMSVISALMNYDSSPLKRNFATSGIGGDIGVSLNMMLPQPVLSFGVSDADESKSAELMALVDESVEEMLSEGFDAALLDAVIASSEFSNSLTTEISNLGFNISYVLSNWWATFGNTDYLNTFYEALEDVKSGGTDYLEELVKVYVADNNHAAVVTTVPEPGLIEKQNKEFSDMLAAKKASMSQEEVSALVKETGEFNAWNSTEVDQELVKEIQAVTISELPEEIKSYEVNDETVDGIRYLTAKANVGEIGSTSIMFDASSVPTYKLHYLNLYTYILGKLPTEAYDQNQVMVMQTRYLNSPSYYIGAIENGDDQFTPVLAMDWMGLMEDYQDSVNVAAEVLLNTDMSKVEEIYNLVNSARSMLRYQIVGNPLNIQIMRSTATYDDLMNYQAYMNGIEYYDFLGAVLEQLSTDSDVVVKELEGIRDMVMNRENMTVLFAGNDSGIETFRGSISGVIDQVKQGSIVRQDYSDIPRPSSREGIAIDTQVQYNMLSASYDMLGVEFDGKYMPVAMFLKENYLYPQIRYMYGAYDMLLEFTDDYIVMGSYRDPNIDETYEVYEGIPEFLESMSELPQEYLDRYILNAYGNYTIPSGELSGAVAAMTNHLKGKTAEDSLEVLRAMKALTASDFKEVAGMFRTLLEKGTYNTVGSPEKLNSTEMFDSIVTF